MEGVFAQLDWPSWGTWALFAAATSVGATGQAFPHIRRAFHQWRLNRRLARDPYILARN